MKRTVLLASLLVVMTYLVQAQKPSQEHIQWKVKTNASIFATPTENNGIIYVGSLDSTFRAIDCKSGKEIWQFKAENDIRSTACVTKKSVFFESGNVLYAVSHKGKQQWKQQLCSDTLKNQLDPWDFYHSSPVIDNGKVFIATQKGRIKAFNAKNGKEVFSYQTPSKKLIRTTPNIDEDVAYFGDWDGVVYAYSFKDKKLNWTYDTRQDTTYMWVNAVQTQLSVTDDMVYFGGRNSRLYALEKKSGKKKWMYASPTDQWILGKPLVYQGKVFVGSSDQHLLLAFDAKTGEAVWETKMGSRTWGNIAAKDGKLYIGSRAFYVIDVSSGKIEKEIAFPTIHKDVHYGEYVDRRGNFHSSPVIVGNQVIVGSDDGNIYCLVKCKR